MDQIELLVMKALSQGLVKGRIDEVRNIIIGLEGVITMLSGGPVCDGDMGPAQSVGHPAAHHHDQEDRRLVPECPGHGAHDREESRGDSDLLVIILVTMYRVTRQITLFSRCNCVAHSAILTV